MSIYDSSYNKQASTGASYQMPKDKHYYQKDNLFNAPNNSMNDAYIWAKNNGIDTNLNAKDSIFAYSQNMYGAPVSAINDADIWSRYAEAQEQQLTMQAQAQALINYNNQMVADSQAEADSGWNSMMNMMMTIMQMDAMENMPITTTTPEPTTPNTPTPDTPTPDTPTPDTPTPSDDKSEDKEKTPEKPST